MHSDYWVKWIVAEQKVQEGLDQARHHALAEMASTGNKTRGGPPWWRNVLLSIADTGRGWMAEPVARRGSTAVSHLSANEGLGAY